MYYITFERHPKNQQIYITFTPTIEEVFETLDKTDIYITLSYATVEPIFNSNLTIHSNIRMDQISVNTQK